MNTLPALSALPAHLLDGDQLLKGLWLGEVTEGHLPVVPGRGRERRWFYSGFATEDGSLAVGAAVVSLGKAGTAFAWALVDGQVVETSRRLFLGRKRVGDTPRDGASGNEAPDESRPLSVSISGSGDLRLYARNLGASPVSIEVVTGSPGPTPVVCATPTPGGGRNVTQKAAGHPARATVRFEGRDAQEHQGFGWYDWTRGRQDRHTTWRWAAGGGRTEDGRSIGINLSTGMNEAAGENVVWLDGHPVAVDVEVLGPVDAGDLGGQWRIEGPGWGLGFHPVGVRAADENLVVVRSRYVQPVGMFHGTVPGPDGQVVDVSFPGVTEDHEALW